MRNLLYLPAAALAFLSFGCSAQSSKDLQKVLTQVGQQSSKPTDGEVVSGLREALSQGAREASNKASVTDGYFKNPRLFIPFPPEANQAATKLRQLGAGPLVDKFVETVNRGAEQAAKSAAPIFINAITSMSISDAWGILRGGRNSATEYLKRSTTAQLTTAFRPTIQTSLNNTQATKYWGDITKQYNQIPMVKKVNTDLTGYVTQKAIDGLFLLVADEEVRIRENPIARGTELLKKVFGYKG